MSVQAIIDDIEQRPSNGKTLLERIVKYVFDEPILTNQKAVLLTVLRHWAENKKMPTPEQIREVFNFSDRTIYRHISALKKLGYIEAADSLVSGRRQIPGDLRWRVYRRDSYACVFCGANECELTLDHIMPVSRGGEDTLRNLVTACGSCNSKKGAKAVWEWRK